MRGSRRTGRITRESAEAMAAQAALFLAEDSGRIGRFLAETGLDPDYLRTRMADPDVLAAILRHLLSDEAALLAFTANARLMPEDVMRAEALLGGASPWEST